MDEEVRKAKAAYHREWRKKNPEKAKAIIERFWLKKVQEIKEREREEK